MLRLDRNNVKCYEKKIVILIRYYHQVELKTQERLQQTYASFSRCCCTKFDIDLTPYMMPSYLSTRQLRDVTATITPTRFLFG